MNVIRCDIRPGGNIFGKDDLNTRFWVRIPNLASRATYKTDWKLGLRPKHRDWSKQPEIRTICSADTLPTGRFYTTAYGTVPKMPARHPDNIDGYSCHHLVGEFLSSLTMAISFHCV